MRSGQQLLEVMPQELPGLALSRYRLPLGFQRKNLKMDGLLAQSAACSTSLDRLQSPQYSRAWPEKSDIRMLQTESIHVFPCTISVQRLSDFSYNHRTGYKRNAEQLWQDLFSDPSQWWDHRSDKANARYPDFKHKKTQEALWVNAKSTPHWVSARLAALAPGTVQQTAFSWNIVISRCVRDGEDMKALELFQEMYVEGVIPDKYTFIPVLKACAGLASLEWGKHIHAQIFQSGYESDIFVASCLVDMYAKCWSIEDAFRVFNNMSKHDAVSWSAMIAGYVHCGQGKRALELFEQMQQTQVLPDSVTFLSVLTACAILSALPEGRHVHARIIHNKCESDVIVSNALIDMYAKCGSLENSCKVFNNMRSRNVISWNTMIVGYAKWGHGEKAFNLFSQMLRERVQPNSVTFVGVLIACTSIGALEEGRYIHAHAIRIGCQTEAFIASGLIDMYAKCGSLDDASNIFSSMPIADVVSWNAMIAGYARCGEAGKALQLFYQMQMEHVKPDSVTFLGVLNACGIIGALNIGRDIHTQVIESGFESHLSVRSCLVEMYTKCGSIDDAYNVFCSMPFHDVVSWNSMILGYVKLGMSEKALRLFSRMQKEGVEPNNVSFMGAVNACARLASLEKGRLVHENIVQSGYGADLSVSNCLIDMYAKCGSIGEACMVFKNMPARTMVSWSVMLGSCAMHGLGKEALRLFAILCHEGLEFDEMTLVSVLTACNHAGLVDEGCYLFEALSPVYDISASTEHYSCAVDMLGRSGYLEEAEELVQIMSSQPDNAVWMALLSACKKYGNLQMGERVAKQILVLDPKNVSAYVLLSTIYASRGHMDSKARIQQIRMERKMQSQAEALP